MAHRAIAPSNAPAAVGPYSPAVIHEDTKTVYVSGQIPLDPQTAKMVGDDVATQTKRVLENLKAVLEGAGSGLDKVLKTTVYMIDLGEFAAMNDVYATFFTDNKPARATVQVGRLPLDALVEIDAIASL